ncbi:MAG: Uma2 family endonuclease [Anaerolineae bacterium]|nr:Uma2 family endonuclease [Anaerolineae bacterium]
MAETLFADLEAVDIKRPPTEDELPYDDGIPMETWRHVTQMHLLLEQIDLAFAGRDYFAAGNMFVYFSPEQVRDYDFRGPDFFVALGVPWRERKSWVVWEEGKAPDVVIELMSTSTARFDKTGKKEIYQDRLRVPEYFYYHPHTGERAGFVLRDGLYHPIKPDAQGRMISRKLDLMLVDWYGEYKHIETNWLRWATLDGELLPVGAELADKAVQRADEAEMLADEAGQRADEAEMRADEAERRANEAVQRANEEAQRANEEAQRAHELSQLLEQYRKQFGELPS